MNIGRLIAKVKVALRINPNANIEYYRKKGMKIGKNPRIFSDIYTPEPYLIEIGDNVTISNNVQLITHDASIIKVIPDKTDLFGKVKIGNNCFIGARAIILCGCTIADNTIIAAGSVVTKSVTESGFILGGNPARVIGKIENFAEKSKDLAISTRGMSKEEKRDYILSHKEILINK